MSYNVIVDHRTGQNFIIPEMADSSLDLSELAKAAKKKLQAVSFELYFIIEWDKSVPMIPHVISFVCASRNLPLVIWFFQLPNHLFEELAMDVYDEVDRRENNQSKLLGNNFVFQLLSMRLYP